MNTKHPPRAHRRLAKRAARKYKRATADRHAAIAWRQLCHTLWRFERALAADSCPAALTTFEDP